MAAQGRMTQTQLVRELAEASGTRIKDARALLDALSAAAIRETQKSGVFVLPGVGKLVRVTRKARLGRNAAAGTVPAGKAIRFRVSQPAKHALRSGRTLVTAPGPRTVSKQLVKEALALKK